MKTNRLTIASILLVVVPVVALVPFQTARADIGPKPSMHFDFAFEANPPPAIVSGIQFECKQADCSDAIPLGVIGPQGFECGLSECSSLAYGYSDYNRLSIDFSDGKTRQSNIFGKEYFEAHSRVTVREDDLLVEELLGGNRPFSAFKFIALIGNTFLLCMAVIIELPFLVILLILLFRNTDFRTARGWYITAWTLSALALILMLISGWGLVVTLVVELMLTLGYTLWRTQLRTKLLTIVLMMNLITQPVLWIVLRNFAGSTSWHLAIGEVIVWLVEGGILAIALRKAAKFWEAPALSLALNLASFGIGFLMRF